MYRQLTLTFVLFYVLAFGHVNAQQSLPQVDSLTYQLYLKKSWTELIQVGNKAIRNEIDYYYLRVRMGIAFFEKANYHEAIRQFEIARSMNNSEAYLLEYLYYAYLFSGRSSEAKLVASEFDLYLKRKTGTENIQLLSNLDFAYNYISQADPSIIENFKADIPSEVNGSQFIPDNSTYYYVGLGLDFSSKFNLYQGYSYLQVNHLAYSQSEGEPNLDKNYTSTLHQYYLAGNMLLDKGLTLLGGIHFIRRLFPVSETIISGPPGPPVETTVTTNMGENDINGFLSIYKRFNKVTFGASYYRGSLGNFIQNQIDAKVILYPFGNLNFYTYSTISFHQQEFGQGNSILNIILDQQIGLKTTLWLWIEGYGTFGNMNNFFMNDGLMVFNRMDNIRQRLGGRLLLLPNGKLKLTIDYSLFQNESEFFPVLGGESFNLQSYKSQAITGIISWTF
ncbi:hypothetical protein [Shivajiella indica]|uniref:YaiO family outer membrane beta-barrel protein n=1 Tax=Shivajiella indica TaxID=872115 RepID=A0ABW5B4I8_9BACT